MDTIPASSASGETWKVYGHDTFAREDYFVGEFSTEAEAQDCVRRLEERHAQSQDEPLRDYAWIVPPDPKK